MVAELAIDDRKIVITISLKDYPSTADLEAYLLENLPDAKCEYVSGASKPGSSFDEYLITIDAIQEAVLMLILRNFCNKNNITHEIDITDN